MKLILVFFTVSIFLLEGCTSVSEANSSPNAVYLDPGPCCSNMELTGDEIFSDVVGYSETILSAINLENFDDLNLVNGDSIFIEFDFSEEFISCSDVCNRFNGIPIELTSVEKI